ncbi:MAG TPA: potassium transporter [Anaeromyxobacter sp.]|nr:potassium transporter [Anaeromyxobacter sp.]
MGELGSTRVFGQHGSGGVVTIGLKRRPMGDLYHWLVTGSWTRLVVLLAIVHFATQGLFGLARALVAVRGVPGGAVFPALLGALPAPAAEAASPFSARAIAAAAVGAVHGFVTWAELVIGAGVVLAKFSLVRARVLFSHVAVVAPHEGGQALMFRMANERTSHIVDAKVSVMLVRNEVVEGELVRKAHDLDLARRGSALFSHAWTAIHPVTRASPLFGESAASLEGAEAEVIVNLSGFDEGLVKTVHARHVYPASRLRWNSRFREIVKVLPDGRHAVDYRRFHKVTPVGEPQTPPERTPARRAR